MKIALLESPRRFAVAAKPLRALAAGEVLVRVNACGVCGTDLHIVEGASRARPPVVLGHEFAGVVEESSRTVRTFAAGDPVAVDPNISCGVCFYCRRGLVHLCSDLRALGVDIDGGMAEYCIVPEAQLYRLPPELPPDASAFIEPLSCCVHGIERANIAIGDTVVILGGGTIGLLMLQLSRAAGAARTVVVEPSAQKRAIAVKLGASVLLDPAAVDVASAVMDLTHVGADVVLECAGRPDTARLALALARRGGTVEFFGVCPIGETIPLEPHAVYHRELSIVGSSLNPHTFDQAIALLQHGTVRVDEFLIHRFPLDGVHEALRHLREGLTIKSIVRPNG